MAGPAHVTLARLCDLIYRPAGSWRHRRLLEPVAADFVQGGVFRYHGIAAVVFRGTDPDRLEDWTAAYRTRQVERSFGLVHEGFNAGAELVLDQVLEHAQPWARSFVVSGHSAGGAVATLLAYRLAADGWPVRELVTFGAPRVGRIAEPSFVFWRYHNGSDVVPHLPPAWSGRWRHRGRLRWLSRSGRVHEPDSEIGFPWIAWALDAVQRRRGELGDRNAAGWADHAIGSYVAKLTARRRRVRR